MKQPGTYTNFDDGYSHPLDFRGIDRDPALVDLQPYKDEVHEARIQREARQAERRREQLRARYAEHGEIKTWRKGA